MVAEAEVSLARAQRACRTNALCRATWAQSPRRLHAWFARVGLGPDRASDNGGRGRTGPPEEAADEHIQICEHGRVRMPPTSICNELMPSHLSGPLASLKASGNSTNRGTATNARGGSKPR